MSRDSMELVGRLDDCAQANRDLHRDPLASILTEAAACIREMVECGERSVDYELWQNDEMVAGSSSEREIRHYAAVYVQDGPVEVFEVVSFRRPLPPAPGAEA